MNQTHDFGVGSTDELSLRVSVATLVRVLFKNPGDDGLMLALERKATLYDAEGGRVVEVKSQPFGGAIRILDLGAIHDVIGDFHFDSEHSRAEQDFRIFIRPAAWSALREFCLRHLGRDDSATLESDPGRELTEEFEEALKINITPEQYACRPIATLVENDPAPTENFYTMGAPTVRVYRVFEAVITDNSLAHQLLKNNESLSHQRLSALALEDFQNGGYGWANAILAVPLQRIRDYYYALPPQERNTPFTYEKNLLDDTVSAILEGVDLPKYERV